MSVSYDREVVEADKKGSIAPRLCPAFQLLEGYCQGRAVHAFGGINV